VLGTVLVLSALLILQVKVSEYNVFMLPSFRRGRHSRKAIGEH
jgi:hypothetical protein